MQPAHRPFLIVTEELSQNDLAFLGAAAFFTVSFLGAAALVAAAFVAFFSAILVK